jgi:hypothetical protein
MRFPNGAGRQMFERDASMRTSDMKELSAGAFFLYF